jgi:ATP-binding cassette, subfamily B, multidrug efflux pump
MRGGWSTCSADTPNFRRSGRRHGVELVLVALFILLSCARSIQTFSAALFNQSLMPNVGTHRALALATGTSCASRSAGSRTTSPGRIANRMMQTAPAVGEATFQTFDALVYSVIYLIGALWLLSDVDPRLWRSRCSLWSGLYVALVVWTIREDRQGVQGFLRRAFGRSPAGSSTATPTSSR